MKYFDYAATTPTSEEALKVYCEVSKHVYGNPGSSKEAKELEEKSRNLILKSLGLESTSSLVFTSGGTEANNLAIKGAIKKYIDKGSHFVTSQFEHASVYEVFKKLEEGNEVSYASVTPKGYIDVNNFKSMLRPETKLVCVMHVNNELGTEQPIKELYNITKEYNKDIIFMTDSVQGLGKVKALDFIPDIMTISSHKIYGPKSVGAVILKNGLSVNSLILGGTKELGQRAGTQSLPAQAGFAKSVETICSNLSSTLNTVKQLREYLESQLNEMDNVYLNSKSDSNVVSVFIDLPVPATQGIEFFYEHDILISAKSADTNDLSIKSRTLKSIGLSDYVCDRTYRISLSHHKTKEDIDYLLHVINKFLVNYKV